MTNNGWWYFLIFKQNVSGWSKLFLAAMEALAICMGFGLPKLEAMLHFRTGETIPKFIKISLLYIVPAVNLAIVIRSTITEFSNMDGSIFGQILRKTLRLIPIIIILIGTVWTYKGVSAETLIKKQYGHSISELEDILKNGTG
mmetsp:Transcript_38365/g.58448  ORF Transcript_38365/g.58448 Transcript_38365/m.58448 type:complete len:143 (-) Transcript_38365:84-512(-)|eukprot:CAMPEP_0170510738 /NCGR_PEP_ID=MMETSP0208-20121228/65929_1 /TAXON_ID=197538 /ORGANISM="Strombidium inclinatum, Strain S3" /LENGTH=142 /DNA_ID=CAMNT_0010794225 /DNA_START=1401 /DNA_END=1832 /DNA_ORIENTATION=-